MKLNFFFILENKQKFFTCRKVYFAIETFFVCFWVCQCIQKKKGCAIKFCNTFGKNKKMSTFIRVKKKKNFNFPNENHKIS